MAQTLKLQNPKFASFYKENPRFDILNYDFHNDEVVVDRFVLFKQV
jgi:hypothetical protein